jgi:hypothetical protein
VKEVQLSVGLDYYKTIGLGHLRGYFCQVLSARDTDRNRKAKLYPHPASYRAGNFGR